MDVSTIGDLLTGLTFTSRGSEQSRVLGQRHGDCASVR